MKKIKPEAIGQMREILSGIILGKLKHDQGSWHCGTAACVAGWHTNLNHKEIADKAFELAQEYARRNKGSVGRWIWDTALACGRRDDQIARDDWGLDYQEGDFMFRSDAGLAQQVGLIEYLADGHRWAAEEDERGVHFYAEDGEAPPILEEYIDRYYSIAARQQWAEKYEQPRPNTDVVEALLKPKAKKPVKKQEVIEEVVEVVTATK